MKYIFAQPSTSYWSQGIVMQGRFPADLTILFVISAAVPVLVGRGENRVKLGDEKRVFLSLQLPADRDISS